MQRDKCDCTAHVVVWPLYRHHYLTMYEGYNSPLAGSRHPQTPFDYGSCSRKLVQLLERSMWARSDDGQANRQRSMSVVRRRVHGSSWQIDHIEKHIRALKRFPAWRDARQAAHAVMALDIEHPQGVVASMAYRDRHRPQATLRGDNALNRKLSAEQVNQMRALYHEQPRPSRQTLAEMFGVSSATVGQIVSGATWKHV